MGPLFLADDVAAVANAMCRHDMALKTFFAQGDVLAMECTIGVCTHHITTVHYIVLLV
jgi:hypothetical protein